MNTDNHKNDRKNYTQRETVMKCICQHKNVHMYKMCACIYSHNVNTEMFIPTYDVIIMRTFSQRGNIVPQAAGIAGVC